MRETSCERRSNNVPCRRLDSLISVSLFSDTPVACFRPALDTKPVANRVLHDSSFNTWELRFATYVQMSVCRICEPREAVEARENSAARQLNLDGVPLNPDGTHLNHQQTLANGEAS